MDNLNHAEPADGPDVESQACVSEEQKPSVKVSRKIGEKIRRDRLNSLILQLAEEVPTVKYAQRRLDKSTILRLTVSYMKLHHGLKNKKLMKECFLHLSAGLVDSVKKAANGALMVITKSQVILFVSKHIADFLGFCQTDMIGHHLDQFVHPEDLDMVAAQFTGVTELPNNTAFGLFEDRVGSGINPFNVDIVGTDQTSFFIRMKKHSKKSVHVCNQQSQYELMHVLAHCEQDIATSQNSGNEQWMVASVKPFSKKPVREIPVTMSEFIKNNEWASMHQLDGTMICVEQRASLYHGFMVSDRVGHQPHPFVNPDDLKYIARSHRLIMINHEVNGTIFRMKTIYGPYLYIESRSIIIHDRWTKEPKCIVSVNTVHNDTEGKKLMDQQRELLDSEDRLAVCDSDNDCENKSSYSSSDNADSGMFSDATSSGSHTPQRVDMYDIKSEVSLDSLCDSSAADIGEDTLEVYMQRAKEYPSLLQCSNGASDCSVNYGVKRSVECEGTHTDNYDVKRSVEYEETDTDNDRRNGLHDTLNNDIHRLMQSPLQSKGLVEDRLHKLEDYRLSESKQDSEPSTSLPILKGILEGRLKLGEGQYSTDSSGRQQGPNFWLEGQRVPPDDSSLKALH